MPFSFVPGNVTCGCANCKLVGQYMLSFQCKHQDLIYGDAIPIFTSGLG